ncbi:MAG: dihydrodipicolinate synthase family protein [Bacillota bacterium]|nr:dihydrodipicolinate synthase family protein [Bacillota bacterium]
MSAGGKPELLPAMLTPFDEAGRPDARRLRAYVDFLVERGADGLFALGTNGLFPLLETAEREALARAVVEAAAGRVPVVVHAGALTTAEAVRLACSAREAGASAVAAVTPYYYPCDEEALRDHFLAIGEAAGELPLYVYNIPSHARNEVTPALLRRLAAELPNLAGVKDSSRDFAHVQATLAAAAEVGRPLAVYVGTESHLLPALSLGATGAVSGVANVFPEALCAVLEAWRGGGPVEAAEAQRRLDRLRALLGEGPAVAPHYAALRLRGLDLGEPRRPLRPLTAGEAARLEARLREEGWLGGRTVVRA